jgi:transcriptional regulator with XRE-family HTH domain
MSTHAVDAGPIRPDWTWGDKVRKVRRISGLSQKEFAERIDVKAPTVAAWETSDAIEPPKGAVAAAKRIYMAFNVSTEWLLGLEVDGRPGPSTPPDGGGSTSGYEKNVRELRGGTSVPVVSTSENFKRRVA